MNLFSPPREEASEAPKPKLAPGDSSADTTEHEGAGETEKSAWVTDADRFKHGRFASKSESFQMGPVEMAPRMSMSDDDGASKRRISQMFATKVIDEQGIDARIEAFRAEQTAKLQQRVTSSARFDPESVRYRQWLIFMILLSAYSMSAAGYFIGFSWHFDMFHAGLALEWVREGVSVPAATPAQQHQHQQQHQQHRQHAMLQGCRVAGCLACRGHSLAKGSALLKAAARRHGRSSSVATQPPTAPLGPLQHRTLSGPDMALAHACARSRALRRYLTSSSCLTFTCTRASASSTSRGTR